MQLPSFILIYSFPFLSSILASPNLLENDRLGTPLGTSFGLPGSNATFDYVVVGGGTAGLTIATRLAENKNVSVAVVEAGGFYEIDNGNNSIIPGNAGRGSGPDPADFQPLVDWGFATVPQKGLKDRMIHYTRGKTLGGSSARNYFFYHRATEGTYHKWADEVRDDSFTIANFLPFYKRSTKYTPPTPGLFINSSIAEDPAAFTPGGGPLQISFRNFINPLSSWMQLAFEAIGLGQISGFNSGNLIGSAFGTVTINPKNGHRSSSESSFLQSFLESGATNLVIYKNSFARRILFSSTKLATGVLLTTEGTYGTPSVNYSLLASKEVILSAGAIQSPQLLMVSGVGSASILENLSIPVIEDLPGVGQNLWDQPLFGTVNRVSLPTASTLSIDPHAVAAAAQAFLNNATGPLSTFGGEVYGWEKLPEPYRSSLSASTLAKFSSQFPADWPELEWIPSYRFQTAVPDPMNGNNYATISNAIVAPTSRGTINIQSNDMTVPPLIDPGYLTDQADAELAVAALKRQREVWAYLRQRGIALGPETLPGPNVTTDAAILDYIRGYATLLWHVAATCKMGKEDDPLAVVDSSTRVFGVKNLRVVDASAFPFLPPGHPQATVYALAEKVADEILRGL